jgi:hypothetical protein
MKLYFQGDLGWLRRVKLGAERSVGLRRWMAWAAYRSFLMAAFPDLRIRGDERLISVDRSVIAWTYGLTAQAYDPRVRT